MEEALKRFNDELKKLGANSSSLSASRRQRNNSKATTAMQTPTTATPNRKGDTGMTEQNTKPKNTKPKNTKPKKINAVVQLIRDFISKARSE
ncbi:hypothetical protein CGMCC3_g15879 [Colletotrichum fructicola]|uniref:Uncharacterized protein n=1 Tax=Colletotrichum fructicola (strain Nara gc5) TaxID=1213859 RepID=A0A7J6IGB8_COLFN|nr:uncharacterized protein CGMCC3_g15879 [Colletotrichum fructicola]KAE9568019.1 hypothetical protein CGMCC3_g15879 [Colletotrichum fructicola]KAF4474405.1 hypothetical protein CGGC5_v016983 [Colletotrichum fructicola Nara gc5]